MVRIDTYSQYFTLTSANYSKLIHIMYDFNKAMITYRMALSRVKGESKPKVVTKADKHFYIVETMDAGYGAKKDVMRYPITLLDSLITYLEDRGIDKDIIEIETHEPFLGRDVDIKLNPAYKPRDYQETYIGKIAELSKHNILIDLYTGGGKSCCNSTPIKIPLGWKPIGDIELGDVVIGRDGKETNVIGVYPQGKRQLYRVTFADGRWVDVDSEHLWSIYNDVDKDYRFTTNTETIINLLNNDAKLSIDLVNPVDMENESCEVIAIMPEVCKFYDKGLSIDGSVMFMVPIDILDELALYVRSQGHLIFIDDDVKNDHVRVKVISGDLCDNKLQILSIEKSIKAEATCIAVDNEDKLYVVKDFIVTHNTFISMASMARINKSFSMIVLPRYIEKWIGDITTLTDIKESEVLVIKGLRQLTDVMNGNVRLDQYKAFIISLTTLNYLIKKYLTCELIEYTSKSPEDLFKVLDTTIVLSDESHQDFYNIYKNMLFANIKMFIGITATLVTKDEDMDRMYNILFPEENRISNIVKMEPYIHITSVRYRFKYKRQIRFKNHFGYNQAILEGSIIKNSVILGNYLNMIATLLRGFYVRKRVRGDKAIIFMATVNMCNVTVDYLKRNLQGFKISKYTEEDGYDTIEKSDIIVSTPGSE